VKPSKQVLESICKRAQYLAVQMINLANHRDDKEKGDPKVGGHPAASSSALHILGALHLVVKSGFDHIAVKPHASPADHSYHYLLDLFLKADLSRLTLEEANQAMHGLRAFPKQGEYVFQSYHSAYDPDHHNFLPSGTVGIPPVNAGYLAHAYRFAQGHGYEVPEAHFWSLIGDAEYREGSLMEAMPDFAEREIGALTWIVDYNRQSLDGHRISNRKIMNGTDDVRIERTAVANGWEVIQVRHGQLRQELFKRTEGETFRQFLEHELEDYELQAFLMMHDKAALRAEVLKHHPPLKKFLAQLSDDELYRGMRDLGGHDTEALIQAMEQSKVNKRKPTLIIAHTLKGWGLDDAALPGNHSSLPSQEEMERMQAAQGLSKDTLFARFAEKTEEGRYLKQRSEKLYADILKQNELKTNNQKSFIEKAQAFGEIPPSMEINFKMASYPHTQWMLGQLTAKLTRIANTSLDSKQIKSGQKVLTEDEKKWKLPAELLVSMAPDVGTSTNLNPAMDGKIFGAPVVEDFETEYGVKDRTLPDLVPGEDKSDRFLRFDISEADVMSCMGSYGKLRDILGIPIIPLMTIYDFFVKRALDQYFYNLYWKSSFILVGTPAGVTLSPEGAQHGWKSDIQIPNQITWEPFYVIELDWILSDAVRRHVMFDNDGRTGVFIRGVTRGADQKGLIKYLSRQARFKKPYEGGSLCLSEFMLEGATDEASVQAWSEDEIFTAMREDVLAGAYYLIDYRGYAGYEPGDNVVNIFAMGSLGTEALIASEKLLAKGIYANVIMVTSPDLLVGNLAHDNNYELLRNRLQIDGSLHLQPQLNGNLYAAEVVTVSGRRVPIVSVHDGEPGLLDNIGSIIGVRHESLAVRKHSRSGRPADIYAYHHIDSEAVAEAVGKVLSETALENVHVSRKILGDVATAEVANPEQWQTLWPSSGHH
jgi:pyruvate dehydrogenase E1 component